MALLEAEGHDYLLENYINCQHTTIPLPDGNGDWTALLALGSVWDIVSEILGFDHVLVPIWVVMFWSVLSPLASASPISEVGGELTPIPR